MVRLAEKHRPRRLGDVVGQSCTRRLRAFVLEPYSTCMIAVGDAGIGKSCTMLALAAELGATDEMSGLHVVCAADLGVDEARILTRGLWQRPFKGAWNVLLIEEFERLSPACQVFLKVALASENLPPRAIVLATSNDVSLIDPALLERFGRPMQFDSWQAMGRAGATRIAELWAAETGGQPLPWDASRWGWHTSNGLPTGNQVRYSLRAAFDAMQDALLDAREVEGQP